MPFVCQICADIPHFDIVQVENKHSFTHYIGHDPDHKATYFLVVMLVYHESEKDYEYSFFILKRFADGSGDESLFDSRFARANMGKYERQMARFIVVCATMELLRLVRPPSVMRHVTLYGVPVADEAAALEKHELISWAFERCGYEKIHYDQYNGMRFWHHKLRDVSGVTF